MCNKSQSLPLCLTLCSQVWILKWPYSNLRALLFYCRCFSFSTPSQSVLPSRLTQSSFLLSPSLSSFPLSDDVPLCQWGGAGGERRNESGSQEAMHLKSPLCHNKTEIDLWLASSPTPFSSERMQTDGWTDGYARTHTNTDMHLHTLTQSEKNCVYSPPGPSILRTKQQVHPRRGSLPCTRVPILQSCSNIKALPKALRYNWRQLVKKKCVAPPTTVIFQC